MAVLYLKVVAEPFQLISLKIMEFFCASKTLNTQNTTASFVPVLENGELLGLLTIYFNIGKNFIENMGNKIFVKSSR